jgi:hypothetical protein
MLQTPDTAARRPLARAVIEQLLGEPFDPREVKFKPAAVNGARALALAYVDARAIQDRLDDVLGVAGWQDEYECLADGSVVCKLRLRIDNEWITKMDVGGPSAQPDEGDRRKAAFSDALKRAAVKFGIGRYLYRLPSQWVDYDPKKKQFARTPLLPPFALPRPRSGKGTVGTTALVESPNVGKAKEPAETRSGKHTALPTDGADLLRRLADYEARLVRQGLCPPGALLHHVAKAGSKAGFGEDLLAWTGPAIVLAVEETKVFEAQTRRKGGDRKEVA